MRNWIFILKSCCSWGITLHAGPDPVQSKLVRYYTLPPRILLNICSTGINSSSWEPEKNVLSLDTVATAASAGNTSDQESENEGPGVVSSYDERDLWAAMFPLRVHLCFSSKRNLPASAPVLLHTLETAIRVFCRIWISLLLLYADFYWEWRFAPVFIWTSELLKYLYVWNFTLQECWICHLRKTTPTHSYFSLQSPT